MMIFHAVLLTREKLSRHRSFDIASAEKRALFVISTDRINLFVSLHCSLLQICTERKEKGEKNPKQTRRRTTDAGKASGKRGRGNKSGVFTIGSDSVTHFQGLIHFSVMVFLFDVVDEFVECRWMGFFEN